MSDYADRWFDFVEEYNQQSSVPLSYVLLPNPQTTGYRSAGSPFGMTTLSKREWKKLMDNNAPARNLGGGVAMNDCIGKGNAGRRTNERF